MYLFSISATALFKLVKIRNYLNMIKKIIMYLLDGIYSFIKIMSMTTVKPLEKIYTE